MHHYDKQIQDHLNKIEVLKKQKKQYEKNQSLFNENTKRWSSSTSFTKLLEKYSLDEVGIWNIYGEDHNPDLHGQHSTPFLEKVEGKLIDVINYATNLPGFFLWGSGGEIRKTEKETIKKV